MLYNGVKKVIEEKLERTAKKINECNNDVLIDLIINEWEDHVTKMGMIRDILMYMDKTRCEQKLKTPVYDLSLLRFNSQVLQYHDILKRLRSKLLKNINDERTGSQTSLEVHQMRNCLRIFHEVDVQKT
eukprot:UN04890